MKPIAFRCFFFDHLAKLAPTEENSRLVDLYLEWAADLSSAWLDAAPRDFWHWTDLHRFHDGWVEETNGSIPFLYWLLEFQTDVSSEFLTWAIAWMGGAE